MKNNNGSFTTIAKILLFFIIGSSAVSCSKFLEKKSKDVVFESNFPKNYWDAEFMLRGVYQSMQPLVDYKVVLGEMRADWVTPGPGADNDLTELAYHNVSNTNKYTDWQPFYQMINRANYAIKNIPRIPNDSNYFNATIKARYIAEARFLRAYGYFHLVQNFEKVPLIMSAVDDISKVDSLFKIAPAPENQILDSIEVDLKIAFRDCDIAGNVPNSFDAGFRTSNEQTYMRARKQPAAGLLAEVYLWRNKYPEAVNICQQYFNLNNDNGVGGGGTTYFDIFRYGIDPAAIAIIFGENLFRVKFDFKARQTNDLMRLTSNDPRLGGRYMIAPSLKAMKTYNPYYPDSLPNNNLANEVLRGFGASYVGGNYPYYNRLKDPNPVIWKFTGLDPVKADSINVPVRTRDPYASDYLFHVYRICDMYLLWAEAANRNGMPQTTIDRINSVRTNRGMPAATVVNRANDTISNSSSVEKRELYILREKGLELGFEGRRWYDIMRMARHRGTPAAPDVNFLSQIVLSRIPDTDPRKAGVAAKLANSKNWYLPYNLEEVKLNPLLVK